MESLARVIVGLLLLALLIRLIQDGPSGVAAWMRAKFLGEVS